MMIKIEYFEVNNNLMYLVQNVTKETTAEILSYLYGMAFSIAEDYVSRHPERCIKKTLEWHYKDTFVPYKMAVYSARAEPKGAMVRKLHVTVRFPQKREVIDVTEMMNSIVEHGLKLDGSEPLPNFRTPNTRVPAGFRKLIHK